VIGALVVVALVVASTSALVFQGRDDGPRAERATASTAARRAAAAPTTSTTSTTASPTTSTTTTTAPPAPPPPPPTEPPAPAPVIPPPPAPAPVCDGAGNSIVNAMNGDRSAAGLGQLCASAALEGFAQSWANWMAANQSLTHQDLGSVLGGTSFNTVAENILSGPGDMSVMQMEAAWMASPGHRQNILNGAFAAAGVGVASSSDGRVWVAVEFGG
jgi:uncharacterized protein YkwD